MTVAPNTPVLVGAAQFVGREDDPALAPLWAELAGIDTGQTQTVPQHCLI